MARKVTAGHQQIRQSEHNTEIPDPTHDIVAVDGEGEVLYETEACWSEQEAEDALEDYTGGLYNDNVGDEVAGWEIRER